MVPPIHLLPDELLQHIFNECCPVDEDLALDLAWEPPATSFRSDLFTLTQVCHLWRDITTNSMQHLWSIISIWMPLTPRHISLAQLLTQRSGIAPLYIFLCCDSSQSLGDASRSAHLDELVTVFAPHHRRWRSLSLCTPLSNTAARHLTSLSFDALECVTTHFRFGNGKLLDAIWAAPRLQRCGVSHLVARGDLLVGVRHYPPSHITHLLLDEAMSMHSLHLVLRHCTQVVELHCSPTEYHPFYATTEPEEDPPMLTIPHLRTLSIMYPRGNRSRSLTFAALQAPSLVELRLVCGGLVLGCVRSGGFLEQFLLRSQCELETLILKGHLKRDEVELSSFLRWPCLQKVKRLRVQSTSSYGSPELSARLIPSLTATLPLLTDIEVICGPYSNKGVERAFATTALCRARRAIPAIPNIPPRAMRQGSAHFDRVAAELAPHGIRLTCEISLPGEKEYAHQIALSWSNLPPYHGHLDLIEASTAWWTKVRLYRDTLYHGSPVLEAGFQLPVGNESDDELF
ncbi:hypothetical protein HGRIS_004997 [Hohenbuehelia grisea]|uniref:F-box domain-containing protein n=1 Tax=Hohenbuehelia grisea TaxID=104357 RepID=A0ABR3JDU9_9AGAR